MGRARTSPWGGTRSTTVSWDVSAVQLPSNPPEAVAIAVVVASEKVFPTCFVLEDREGLVDIGKQVVGVLGADIAEGVDVLLYGCGWQSPEEVEQRVECGWSQRGCRTAEVDSRSAIV